MFDIGFTELITIGVVALIVIGPERLPKVARTAGHLYARMQRYVSAVKTDISREMEFDELRRTGQEFKESIALTVSDVQEQASVVDDYLREESAGFGKAVTSSGEIGAEDAAPHSETAMPAIRVEHPPQQNLPLDEPDQNYDSGYAAVVETARSESTAKSA